MTDNCNSDILATARSNVAARQMPANGRAVLRGEWDEGSLVREEMERLLKNPALAEDVE
jgi:hypothetical protein